MKVFNRNHLKLIALMTMLIDHIGSIFVAVLPTPIYYICRIVGRISFPIFAYFVSQGYIYTKNRRKYLITIAIFAILTQPIFYLAFGGITNLNVLFTFLIAGILMLLYDKIYKNQGHKIVFLEILSVIVLILIALESVNIASDYGVYGILLTFLLYVLKDSNLYQMLAFVSLLIIYVIIGLCIATIITFDNFLFLFSLLAIPLIYLYNGKNGKLNIKYLFYIFYPIHLAVLIVLKIILL